MNTPKITHITCALLVASTFACGRTPALGAGDPVDDSTASETDDGLDVLPADLPPESPPDAEWGWEPEPDLPEGDGDGEPVDECSCHDPALVDGDGDGDGDPAGPGGECVCEDMGSSFCYHPFGCAHFTDGCPDGWTEICDP